MAIHYLNGINTNLSFYKMWHGDIEDSFVKKVARNLGYKKIDTTFGYIRKKTGFCKFGEYILNVSAHNVEVGWVGCKDRVPVWFNSISKNISDEDLEGAIKKAKADMEKKGLAYLARLALAPLRALKYSMDMYFP